MKKNLLLFISMLIASNLSLLAMGQDEFDEGYLADIEDNSIPLSQIRNEPMNRPQWLHGTQPLEEIEEIEEPEEASFSDADTEPEDSDEECDSSFTRAAK